MSLVVRKLRLRASTEQGVFGGDLAFDKGLNIVRADNSRGKSTAVRGLVYALGLERMITTRPQQALTSAMRDALIYDASTKAETPVLSSWVDAEIEFEHSILTVRRQVAGGSADPRLVRVWDGAALTAGEYPHQSSDYFVGWGSVGSDRGYHRLLAGLLGWEMPTLESSEGAARLYLEQVFPLLLVEQQRGWGGIQAQTPSFSGPPDIRRRALEFLLTLDAGRVEAERARLKRTEASLASSWRQEIKGFERSLAGEGLVLGDVPSNIVDTWPLDPPARIRMPTGRDSWQDIDDILGHLRVELEQAESTVVLTSSDMTQDAGTEAELASALEEVDEYLHLGNSLRTKLIQDRRELDLLHARREALDRDRREHQDIVKLQSLGSDVLGPLYGDCPACHQPLEDATLVVGTDKATLSSEASLDYITQQLELVDVMIADGDRTLRTTSERLAALRVQASAARRRARALRQDLVAPSGTPSSDVIERRLQLTSRIERLTAIEERFALLDAELARLAEEAGPIRAALKRLPRGKRLSESDQAKLHELEQSFLSQLSSYGFGSFAEERLSISPSDYMPKREEFDLQADISASDAIRVIWAYLIGLFETADHAGTAHPQWLLFDEPRQQSARDVSFEALLARAAKASHNSGQIIFVTSEDPDRLSAMVRTTAHTAINIDGYLLKALEDQSATVPSVSPSDLITGAPRHMDGSLTTS